MTHNYTSRPEQYLQEYLAWMRMLEFYKEENIFFKTRLSEVVDHEADKDFLALAEQFQNQFIIKDDFIDELRHDINAMEVTVKENKTTPGIKLEIKHNKLRNGMEYLEKSFTQLKKEFNGYLLSIV